MTEAYSKRETNTRAAILRDVVVPEQSGMRLKANCKEDSQVSLERFWMTVREHEHKLMLEMRSSIVDTYRKFLTDDNNMIKISIGK